MRILLFWLAIVPSVGAQPLLLELDLQRDGAASVLGVRLVSAHGGRAEIALPDHSPPMRFQLRLAANEPRNVSIPVRWRDRRTLGVEARLGETVVRDEVAWPGAGAPRELAAPAVPHLRTMLAEWPGARGLTPLAVFFMLYLVTLHAFARGKRRYLLLSLPIGASVLALVVWSNGAAERRLVTWSELTSGEDRARVSALLQISGRGRGTIPTSLPAKLQPPVTLTRESPVRIERDLDAAAAQTLEVDSTLLSRHEFWLTGTEDVTLPIDVSLTPHGPTVRNTGNLRSPAALAGWEGKRFEVPALDPGSAWTPPREATAWQVASAAERTLRAASANGAAVLVRSQPAWAGAVGPGAETRGWLLIRAASRDGAI
jgi:hypothetical protein